MTKVSDVPSVIDGLPGHDRFKLLPVSEDPEDQKNLDVEVWHLIKDSNLEQIFGTDKEKQKGLLISPLKIKEIHKALAEGGNMQDYSMIFLYNDHGRHKVMEIRRNTGMEPQYSTCVLSKKDWVLSSQSYVLVVPKLT